MASKPPKLVVTVSGPLDSGKTHLLIKLQEFLRETYGSDIKVKADALTLTRYDGHEHGPARPHRGSEIELRSETTSDLNLVIDPDQPGIHSDMVVHSSEHHLTVYRDTQRVYSVQGVALMLVPNVQLLPRAAREWAINALAGNTAGANPFRNHEGFIHNELERVSMETCTRIVYCWDRNGPVTVEELNGAAYAWARLFGGEPRIRRKYVESAEHRLSLLIPRCTMVDTRTGASIADWGTLSEEAFDWALAAMRDNDCRTMADMHEYRRRPWLLNMCPPPVPKEEQPVTKLLKPRESWLARLKGFLFDRPPTSRPVEDLKVTTDSNPMTPPQSMFAEGVSEPRVCTDVEQRPSGEIRAEHYAVASKPHYGSASFEHKLQAVTYTPPPEAPELAGRMYLALARTPDELQGHAQAQGLTLPEPVEVDDFTLAVDDGSLTVNEALMEELTPEVDPHEVEAATQEVIDRLGGIVPHHHGHARKVMPLEGPTGKKSNYNVRNQKPHGKKKPRR